MRLTSYLEKDSDFNFLTKLNVKEVLLAPKVLSKKGSLKLDELTVLAEKAKELGFRTVLEWDILINEQDFEKITDLFFQLNLVHFDSIRVQDPGALEFIIEKTSLGIQWITEHGNHNLIGLKTWEKYIGSRLERIVVSNEISFKKLCEYEDQLKVPLEILILGKILLFYTPRNLLSPVFEQQDKEIQAIADSEESPHKGFFLIQNRHGSFMYHLKERCLLNELEKLQSFKKLWCRIDHLFLKENKIEVMNIVAQLLTGDKAQWDEFKEVYPVGLTKGFFLTNKTDVLFPKLKNYRLLRSDSSYVGEVVDVLRGEYIVFHQRSQQNLLKVGDKIHCSTPEGKELGFEVSKMQSLEGEDISNALHNQLILLPYRKTIVSKTVVNLV